VKNRLTQLKDSGGASLATFTYDHQGKRTSMTTSSGTVYFHYNGDKVIYETDANNNIIADYTWDSKGNPVTMTKGGITYYYHINGHGDVTKLTDASGNVVAEYQYDAWGNITFQSSGTIASSNPYRYAGYRYDKDTSLYYLNARYYDSNVGRFITRDSFYGIAFDTQSLNLYNYCQSNPVGYVDTSGHFALDLKQDLSTMAANFLLPRGDNLSYLMFVWGLYAGGADFSSSTLLVSKLKGSSEVSSIKAELFRKMPFTGLYAHYHSPTELLMLNYSRVFNSTQDLAYAVGKANYNAYAQKVNGAWNVAIRIWDTYDFSNWRWSTNLGNNANNLGLILQNDDLLIPYNWNVRFTL
jgi:RHS repeat-associated protein